MTPVDLWVSLLCSFEAVGTVVRILKLSLPAEISNGRVGRLKPLCDAAWVCDLQDIDSDVLFLDSELLASIDSCLDIRIVGAHAIHQAVTSVQSVWECDGHRG